MGKKTKTPNLTETTEFIDILEIERLESESLIVDLREEIRSGRFWAEDIFSETGRRVRPARGSE